MVGERDLGYGTQCMLGREWNERARVAASAGLMIGAANAILLHLGAPAWVAGVFAITCVALGILRCTHQDVMYRANPSNEASPWLEESETAWESTRRSLQAVRALADLDPKYVEATELAREYLASIPEKVAPGSRLLLANIGDSSNLTGLADALRRRRETIAHSLDELEKAAAMARYSSQMNHDIVRYLGLVEREREQKAEIGETTEES